MKYTGIITKNDFFVKLDKGPAVFEKENKVSKEPYLFVGFQGYPSRYTFVAYNSGFGTYKRASFDKFTWNYDLRNSTHEKDINIDVIPTEYLKNLFDYIKDRRNHQYKYMYCETIKSAIERELSEQHRVIELNQRQQRRNHLPQTVIPQIPRVQPRTQNIEKNRIKEFLMDKVKAYFLKYNNIPKILFSEINFDAPVEELFKSGIETLDFFLHSDPEVINVDKILSYIIGPHRENDKIIQTIQSFRQINRRITSNPILPQRRNNMFTQSTQSRFPAIAEYL